MKLLLISYAFSPDAGAEARMSFNLYQAFKARGHQVRVITKDPERVDDSINIEPRGRLRGSAGIGKAHKIDYFPFVFEALKRAREIAGEFDLIQHLSPRSLRYPDPLCRLPRPFVWGPLGGSIDYPPGFSEIQRKESWLQRLRALDRIRLHLDPLLRATLEHSAAIVITSNAAARKLPQRYRPKAVVLPEEVDLADLQAEPVGALLEQIDAPYVFSSARLIPYKAMDLLLRAFAIVAQRDPAVKLVITGRGPELNNLLALRQALALDERVLFLGKVGRSQNLALMSEALLCAFPALNEAFGGVNLEAMAMGKAVVVTDWGGPADIVVDAQTGFKVAPAGVAGLIDGFAARISQLLEDADLREQMGAAGRARVEAEFTTSVNVRRYEQLFERLLAQR